MKKLIRDFVQKVSKSDFAKNVVTVLTGTALSQIIVLAITPILTRNYSPKDFGFLVIYISLLSIVGTCSTGKFERAIFLVEDKNSIKKIVFLSFTTSIFICILLTLFFLFGQEFLSSFLELDGDLYGWLFTLSLLIVFYSSYTVFNVILNYQKRFKKLATAKIIKSVSSVVVSLSCIFFLNDARGLVLGEIVGYVIAALFVISANIQFLRVDKEILKESPEIAKRFKDFPLFNIPSDFLNMSSSQMPVFFLTTYMGANIAGFFSLTKRVLDAPVKLLSTSVLEVFRQKASEDFLRKGECKALFVATAKNLFLLAITPFSLLFIFGPNLFSFVFGEEWYVAGEYARIFSVFYFFKFISSPLSYMFFIAEKQKINFFIHLYIFISSLIVLNLPNVIEMNAKEMLWCYCINFIIVYVFYFQTSYRLAAGKTN